MATDTPENQEQEEPNASVEESQATPEEPSRRTFFKRVAVGGGAALLGGGATLAATSAALEGRPTEDAFSTDETFKPKDQRDVILTFARSPKLNEEHAWRNEQYSKLQGKDFHFMKSAMTFEHRWGVLQ